MGTIGVRELKVRASEVIRRSEKGERFLVTKRGKPVSVLLPIGADLEDLILANAPGVARRVQRGRAEFAAGKTVPLDKVLKGVRRTTKRVPRRAR